MKKKLTLEELPQVLLSEVATHSWKLRGKSGRSPDWEAGFIAGLNYVREHLLSTHEVRETPVPEAKQTPSRL